MAKPISPFELVVGSISPPIPGFPAPGNRTVIKTYQIFISNLNAAKEPEIAFKLRFTVGGMPLNSGKLFTIFDGGTGNIFDILDAHGKTGDLLLPSGYTGVFRLQPDLRKLGVLPQPPAEPPIELRGYAEIEISPNSANSSARLLVAPQQRHLFWQHSNPGDLTQEDCPLPSVDGSALVVFP
jgi:hypothetical protein